MDVNNPLKMVLIGIDPYPDDLDVHQLDVYLPLFWSEVTLKTITRVP